MPAVIKKLEKLETNIYTDKSEEKGKGRIKD